VKVAGQYYQDILLSQQTLTAIRHVTDDNSVFEKDSTPVHGARSTGQLLHPETLSFLSLPELRHQQPRAETH